MTLHLLDDLHLASHIIHAVSVTVNCYVFVENENQTMKLFTARAVYETKQNKLKKQNSFLISDNATESDTSDSNIQFHGLGV